MAGSASSISQRRRPAAILVLLAAVALVTPLAEASALAAAVRQRSRRPAVVESSEHAVQQQDQVAARHGGLAAGATRPEAAAAAGGDDSAAPGGDTGAETRLLITDSDTAMATEPATAAAAAAAAAVPSQVGNSVSLSGLKKFTLIVPLAPLGRPPTPPDAYSKLPVSSWNFTGSSPGYMVVTRHELAPSLVLTELMYFPGTYTPPVCSSGNTRFSAMRFWVDMAVSANIGRSVWGFPKEIGSFAWSDTSVALTVKGALVFSANFTSSITRRYAATPIGNSTKFNSYAPRDWLASLAQGGIRTMQFPLKPALAAADVAGESAAAAEEPIAVAAGSRPSSAAELQAAAPRKNPAVTFFGTSVPNLQVLRFPGCSGLLNIAAASVFIDPQAFTGGAAVPAWNSAQGAGLLLDTPGELSPPVQLACR